MFISVTSNEFKEDSRTRMQRTSFLPNLLCVLHGNRRTLYAETWIVYQCHFERI
jgi:hypothetical protein